MSITRLNLQDFLQLAATNLVLDVRSPGEYAQAHIPNAISLPLFSDEERKIVGTAYKQESRQKAIKHGLKYFGSSMVGMVETVEAIFNLQKPKIAEEFSKVVLVHCWRGGMRSAAVAWLLDLYGFKVYTLIGGYKAYRHWVLKHFENDYNIKIIGGYTGSGKTPLLHQLQKNGEKIIDLEGLANHKGSAFGGLGVDPQPTQEMFENLLATALSKVENENEIIWIENESQRIGNLNIPTPFFNTLRKKALLFLNIPFEERLNHIVNDYGKFSNELLINAILRIKKRLGGLDTKNAINFLLEDNIEGCFRILLNYYDRGYWKSTSSRTNAEQLITTVDAATINEKENAKKIIDYARGNEQH
jgi:tRNA 2-selenouridine synthase